MEIELPPEVEANLARIRKAVCESDEPLPDSYADIAWLIGLVGALQSGRFQAPQRVYTSRSHPYADRLRAKGVTTCCFCPHGLKDHYRNCCGAPGCACPGLGANLADT